MKLQDLMDDATTHAVLVYFVSGACGARDVQN